MEGLNFSEIIYVREDSEWSEGSAAASPQAAEEEAQRKLLPDHVCARGHANKAFGANGDATRESR